MGHQIIEKQWFKIDSLTDFFLSKPPGKWIYPHSKDKQIIIIMSNVMYK